MENTIRMKWYFVRCTRLLVFRLTAAVRWTDSAALSFRGISGRLLSFSTYAHLAQSKEVRWVKCRKAKLQKIKVKHIKNKAKQSEGISSKDPSSERNSWTRYITAVEWHGKSSTTTARTVRCSTVINGWKRKHGYSGLLFCTSWENESSGLNEWLFLSLLNAKNCCNRSHRTQTASNNDIDIV